MVLEHFHFYSAQEGAAKCDLSWGVMRRQHRYCQKTSALKGNRYPVDAFRPGRSHPSGNLPKMRLFGKAFRLDLCRSCKIGTDGENTAQFATSLAVGVRCRSHDCLSAVVLRHTRILRRGWSLPLNPRSSGVLSSSRPDRLHRWLVPDRRHVLSA